MWSSGGTIRDLILAIMSTTPCSIAGVALREQLSLRRLATMAVRMEEMAIAILVVGS
jgi:hypothetical protein